MEAKDIYVSLDEAREEVKKRWNNVELRKAVENELGDRFMPYFAETSRGVLWKNLQSPDNGFTFFYRCCKYVNVVALGLEYQGDKFVHFNEEKKGLGRLHLEFFPTNYGCVDIVDFHLAEKKKVGELKTKNGQSLVDFHHDLMKLSGYDVETGDITDWCNKIGKAKDYYYPYLLHFVAHGVLFDTFLTLENPRENSFTQEVVLPALNKIKDKFGLSPLVLHLYPENQTEEEDFYWWSYPPDVNFYLVDFVKKNSLFDIRKVLWLNVEVNNLM